MFESVCHQKFNMDVLCVMYTQLPCLASWRLKVKLTIFFGQILVILFGWEMLPFSVFLPFWEVQLVEPTNQASRENRSRYHQSMGEDTMVAVWGVLHTVNALALVLKYFILLPDSWVIKQKLKSGSFGGYQPFWKFFNYFKIVPWYPLTAPLKQGHMNWEHLPNLQMWPPTVVCLALRLQDFLAFLSSSG